MSPDWLMGWRDGAQAASYSVSALAIAAAGWKYVQSKRLERSQWILKLYEKFYEEPRYKAVRNTLDNGTAIQVEELVSEEKDEFTDYLNFFELIAYLHFGRKQINRSDVEVMFRYYLRCLRKHKAVMAYLADKDFGELEKLLNEEWVRTAN